MDGFALAGSRAAQGMPSAVKDAKIALLDFGLQRHKLQLGVQVRGGLDSMALSLWFVWRLNDRTGRLPSTDTPFVSSKVVVKDVKEVDLIRQREMDITKERIQKILEAGANVILTTKGIDDLALKVFNVSFRFVSLRACGSLRKKAQNGMCGRGGCAGLKKRTNDGT